MPEVTGRQKKMDDPAFGDDAVGELSGLYDPLSGFMDDPMLAAHNYVHAAKHHGAETRFKSEVVSIDNDGKKITGVTLASGEKIEAPIVVNAALIVRIIMRKLLNGFPRRWEARQITLFFGMP